MICFTGISINAQNINLIIVNTSVDSKNKNNENSKYFKDSLSVIKYLNQYRNNYIEQGYLLSSFDSIVSDSNTITAYFNRGNIFNWGEIGFNADEKPFIKNQIIYNEFNKGKPVNINKFLNLHEKIIEIYENKGYPFVSSFLDSIEIDYDKITGVLIIEDNGLFKIDSLNIRGGLKISSNYISRYLGIGRGDAYNESAVRKIETRLSDLPFVQIIRSPEIGFYNNKAHITIYAKPQKANQFNGILGVVPNDKTTNKVLFTGNINLLLVNSFNKGEYLSFEWEKLESSTQRLNLDFKIAYLYKNAGYNMSFGLFKKDTSYLNVNIKNSLLFSFAGNNHLSLFYESKSSILLNSAQYQNITVLPDFSDTKTNLFGLGLKYQFLDYVKNPRKGVSVNFDLGAGKKTIIKNTQLSQELYDGIDLISVQAEGLIFSKFYLPVFNRFTFLIKNMSGMIKSDKVFENELFRIGGLKTIRGFDEGSINAENFSIISIEPRYLFEKNSSLFVFIDYGFYEKNINDYVRDNPIGIGLGIDMDTKAGTFSLAYAIGSQFDNPFELKSAKIHFGYLNRF